MNHRLYPDYASFFDLSEVNKCMLCHDPVCSHACPQNAPVGSVLRSLYFENYLGAIRKLGSADCASCSAPCEKACILSRDGIPVKIRHSNMELGDIQSQGYLPKRLIEETDLSVDICGVKLENPFLLSSSVVASTYEMCKRAFEAGWAGAAFKTICSFPQHEASPRFSVIRSHSHSFCGFKNIEQLSDHSVEENMAIFRKLREEFPTKVIVASIMGQTEAEWASLAKKCEQAGASAIECNFSCPNMEAADMGVTIGQSEELIEKFTRATKSGTSLPVLAKLTPNITDMVPMALAAKRGGANGISAINTINSITGVDIDTLVAQPAVQGKSIVGGYSGPAVKPIALRFISDLSGCEDLKGLHISGMGGVETWRDALEFILLGAGSVQITTAVMQYGYRIIDDLIEGLSEYMKCKGVASLRELIGGASKTVVDHQSIERGTVVFPLFDSERCIGCGRCYVSCMDGGHQAIEFDPATRKPKLIGNKCVGCHLCRLVCSSGAISAAKKSRPQTLDSQGNCADAKTGLA
ncbi:MAG: NAD-dependent dihydropyrimidine dehydrogenase subunit PreA [Clostridia bacterium]|nr:NAD-dependent dihydropyrimidine dehydrogenase subunit PreA [Clostridia bacterium]